ncbi:hypothetical protein CFE70_001563 [Pyrenophora teres f. teres 0-1]
MAVARHRVLDLMRVQCNVFNTTYNPERIRLGSRILHQRLKGPAVASYYPRASERLANCENSTQNTKS